MINPRILLVGSRPATVQSVSAALAGHPYETETVATDNEAVTRLSRDPIPDLVLLELGTSNGEALRTLQRLRQIRPDVNVVVLSSAANNWQVAEAIRSGAQDYLTMPVREGEILDTLRRNLRRNRDTKACDQDLVEDVGGDHLFIAASPQMRKVRIQAELLANIDGPVLILGESGTGKEVTAHLIHKLSRRSRQRFLKVNCAALPGELLESELFGYERGAFTGAMRTKPGKFELCDKGTILLDEVAEMSANLQAKLLHVLQDRQFFRLGGETTVEVDVRILAATNVNIQDAIAERRFREDLYYRLSAFTLSLPPLRERREEIPILLRHFMQVTSSEYSRPPLEFSPRLLDACVYYSWPGNLRQLQNFVTRYLVMADESMAIGELGADRPRKLIAVNPVNNSASQPANAVQTYGNGSDQGTRDLKFFLRSIKDEAEIEAIKRTLAETNWNRKRAARLLHISYRGLLYKIQQHGITRVPEVEIRPPLSKRSSAP
jgi:two-component system, NtrC family, response regulator AtoC